MRVSGSGGRAWQAEADRKQVSTVSGGQGAADGGWPQASEHGARGGVRAGPGPRPHAWQPVRTGRGIARVHLAALVPGGDKE